MNNIKLWLICKHVLFSWNIQHRNKGTYSAAIGSVVSFISVPWPFLLSASFATKTQHMDWVLEPFSNEQKQELGRTRLVHWQERERANYKPPEKKGVERGAGGRNWGVCATSVYLRPCNFFLCNFPNYSPMMISYRKQAPVWKNMTHRRAGIRSQDCTIVFPGRGSAPARCRKWSCICWADTVLQLLQFCLQPEREIKNREGDKGKLRN